MNYKAHMLQANYIIGSWGTNIFRMVFSIYLMNGFWVFFLFCFVLEAMV